MDCPTCEGAGVIMVGRHQYTSDPVADADAFIGDEEPCGDCGGTGVDEDCHEDDARFDELEEARHH